MNGRKKFFRLHIFAVSGLLLLALCSFAMPVGDVPDPLSSSGKMVQDSGGVLSPGYVESIDALCKALREQCGAEIAVITVDNLDGDPIEDYAVTLFNRLGIGHVDRDDGVLILFSREDRRVRLEIGYGIEPIITDGRAGTLLRTIAIPEFKKERYGRGLYLLTQAVADKIAASKGQQVAHVISDQFPAEKVIESLSYSKPHRALLVTYYEGCLIFAAVLVGYAFLMTGLISLRIITYRARAAKVLLAEKTRFGAGVFTILGFVGFMAVLVIFDRGFLAFFIMFFIFLATFPLQLLLRQKMLAKAKVYTPSCRSCKKPMRLLTEKQDNKFLTPSEIAEEKVKGMDYEFWVCNTCERQQRFSVRMDGADRCKKCRKYTLIHQTSILKKASTRKKGKQRITSKCANPECDYIRTRIQRIPKISTTGSGSHGGSSFSGGGGSFGGGSSGGGGASGGW